MASRLDWILKGPPQTGVGVPRAEVPKGGQAGLVKVSGGSRPHAVPALTLLQGLRQVGMSPAPNLLPRLRQAIGSSP